MGKGTYIGIVVLLLLIVLVVAIFVYKPKAPTSLTSTFLVQLTDPPQVPNGTQSLVITYSNIQLHNSNTNGFINLDQSGSINLLGLVNFTQTIGMANVPPNSTFDLVRFNVTSAKITINNQTYNVSVPNNRVTVSVHANSSTSGGVLVDLTPSVIQIYSANQTIFVMVPSARAVVIGKANVNASSATVGHVEAKSHEVDTELKAAAPNMTIIGASASVNGNTSTISVTVRDNSNKSIVLKHMMVFGTMKANLNASIGANVVDMMPDESYGYGLGASASANATVSAGNGSGIYNGEQGGFSLNGVYAGMMGESFVHNFSAYINSSGGISSSTEADIMNEINASLSGLNATQKTEMESMMNSKLNLSIMMSEHEYNLTKLRTTLRQAYAFRQSFHDVLNFIVNTNGTLSLPFLEAEAEGPNGYVLQPGQNVTLSFSGTVHFGQSVTPEAVIPTNRASVMISLIPNQTYSIRIIGEDGAFASTNVVAS